MKNMTMNCILMSSTVSGIHVFSVPGFMGIPNHMNDTRQNIYLQVKQNDTKFIWRVLDLDSNPEGRETEKPD